jgi:hypothetical protein
MMSEKMKKRLTMLAYQAALALGIFIILFVVDSFAPQLLDKLSSVWTKNTDIKKAGRLLLELSEELIPF